MFCKTGVGDKMKRYIAEGMTEYLKGGPVPWHMPGHKRKKTDFSSAGVVDQALNMARAVDLTEVPGTDDLYNPKDMIRDSLDSLAKVYQTFASYYLVNGSTGGIFAAVAACFKGKISDKGKKKILVARNCHKSVYNAVDILGLESVYIYPDVICGWDYMPDIYGAVSPETVEKMCKKNPDIGAFILTSPTYEGVVSDIASISRILKKYGIKLIVDEAHGAHFPFMKDVPKSAIYCGADLVVQSLHKTLDALTQTAILHVVDRELDEDIKKFISVFMTSSPSYLFMSSMEQAVYTACNKDFQTYVENLTDFRKKAEDFRYIKLLNRENVISGGGFDYDFTRLVITTSLNKKGCKKDTTGYGTDSYITGTWLGYKLDKIGRLVVEMTGTDYVVLISTAADTREDFEYLYGVLHTLDKEIGFMSGEQEKLPKAESDLTGNLNREEVMALIGTKAIDNIYVYPPGSYMITEGEIITEPVAEKIIELMEQGKEIRGKLI